MTNAILVCALLGNTLPAQNPDASSVQAPAAPAPVVTESVVAVPGANIALEAPAPVVVPPAPAVEVPPPLAPVPAPVLAPAPVAPAPAAPAVRTTAERFGSWQVGVAGGAASGYGFSVRRWFGDANAVQLNFAPYVSKTNYPGTDDPGVAKTLQDSGFVLDASLSAGLSWLHQVVQVPLFEDRGELKVLSYVAGSTYLSVEQQQMDRFRWNDGKQANEKYYDDYYRTKKEFRLGGGGGCEISRWRLSADLMVGLGGWYETVSEDFGFAPDAQIGAHFRF